MHYDYTINFIKIQVCQTDTKNIERRQSQPLGPFRQISEKPSSAGKARVVAIEHGEYNYPSILFRLFFIHFEFKANGIYMYL